MSDGLLSDEQIAALTPAQRRHLISRLQQPVDDLVPPSALVRVRRIRTGMMVGCTVVLIPWILFLDLTLPQTYVADDWPATWIGFDILLVAFMLVTVVLGHLRRQLLLFAAFTTGVLLICDVWFDLMTAQPGDFGLSVLTALLAELPLAIIMIRDAVRILRLTLSRLWLLEPGMRLWQVPLLP